MSGDRRLLQNSQLFRRIVWRDARLVSLKCHFVAAEVRERGAEMAQVRQIYGSDPPPRHLGAAAADIRE